MNQVVRSQGVPAPGTRSGDWVWNGSNWVCDPDCGPPGFCPPSFFPPVVSPPLSQPPWYPGANGGITFASTAPPNPVRGHLWWDGTTLRLFDGGAWVNIGPLTTPTGVTDGSNAQPGQVGEFMRFSVNVPFTATTLTNVNVQLGTLSPGDWDCWSGLETGQGTGPTSILLSPAPPGASNLMHAALGSFTNPATLEWSILSGPQCRISSSVPSLIAMQVFIDNTGQTGVQAGTAVVWLEARRRR